MVRGSLVRGSLLQKFVASSLAIVAIALLANGILDIWFSYQDQKRILVRVQADEARLASERIDQFFTDVVQQMQWANSLPSHLGSADQARLDAIRLLKEVPAIIEFTQVDAQGREELHLSRVARDVIASGADLSSDTGFLKARQQGAYFGPVSFRDGSEPRMTLAVSGTGPDARSAIVELNLKFLWDLVARRADGSQAQTYVTDADGRLIAHPDLRLVLSRTDMSALVTEATSTPALERGDGRLMRDIEDRSVLSVWTKLDRLGWLVFVDVPVAEVFAPIYLSMFRSGAILIGALLCSALAASLVGRRLARPIQSLSDGAARIGSGDLAHRIDIATDDEFQVLGDSFNRMATRLQESYALLESKVTERTAELAHARDLAVAEHAEAERAKRAAELANETRSRFLAVFSHEIRTPLNGMIGILQILERRRTNAAQRRLLDMASSSGATLVSLVDAILDYAQLEAGTERLSLSDFDVLRLMDNATGLMRPQAEKKGLTLELVHHFAEGPHLAGDVVVGGDSVRINRVLLNLLTNAIKFTASGGIRVEVELKTEAPDQLRLHIAVSDTGMGVPPDMQERIFEDFVQADAGIGRRFGGTGLGLAISRRLAVLMGGDLTCESRLGSGSTFRLALPVAQVRTASARAALATPAAPLTVLVADDDEVNREVGVAMLRDLGHVAMAVATGAEAIDIVRERPCDVVLMDIHMPNMDGVAVAAAIQSLALDHPPRIIGVTADLTVMTRDDLGAVGIMTVLAKPLMREALRRALADPGAETSPVAAKLDAAQFGPTQRRETGTLDESFIAEQLELLGKARLAFLAELFARTSSEVLDEIERAATQDDRDTVRKCAHRMAGSASALGLSELAGQAGWIETQGGRMSSEALAGAIDKIGSLRRRSITVLDAWLADRVAEHHTV
ncbi:Signal transduction histidine kinase [Rhizobiales bacterium GAS191]|nr:Signal transduction histidine kinase [Rhizobiales bacterium GAS113]SED11580.1 Signal transduction histidine kinase [Rhizobiales bacterium GAS191]